MATEALEQLGSLERLCRDRRQQAERLGAQAKELASQVKALNGGRQQVAAAIKAVEENALVAVARVSQETLEHLETFVNRAKDYGELERQAGALEQEVLLAKAFKSQEPELQLQRVVPRSAVRQLLAGLVLWSQTDTSRNPYVAMPRSLSSRLYHYSSQTLSVDTHGQSPWNSALRVIRRAVLFSLRRVERPAHIGVAIEGVAMADGSSYSSGCGLSRYLNNSESEPSTRVVSPTRKFSYASSDLRKP